MRTCIVVVSDLHCNSKLGLCPAGPIPLKDGATYTPNAIQEQLWEWWLQFFREIPDCNEWWLVVNGDVVEGVSYKAHQLVRPSVSFQTAMATQALQEGLVQADKPPAHIFFVRGTPWHTGEEADQETLVAQNFKAVKDPESDAETWWHLKFEVQGKLFDFRHTPSTFSLIPGAQGPAISRLAHRIWEARNLNRVRIPDVVIRSHVHVYMDSGYNPPRPRAVTTPCWKFGHDDYVSKKGIEHLPSLGGLYLTVRDDGPVIVEPNLFTFDEEEPWRA